MMTKQKEQELIRALEFTDMAINLAEREIMKLKQVRDRMEYLEWKLQHFKEMKRELFEELDIVSNHNTDV